MTCRGRSTLRDARRGVPHGRVFVGADGLQRLARRAGMRHFVAVIGVWGRSRITASDQARFFQRIDACCPAGTAFTR